MTKKRIEVLLASPRGFCAGVSRAVEIVERALEIHGSPVYVLHEIVHNKHVLDGLQLLGARFVETLAQVPEGAVTVLSAHGVAQRVEQEARARRLRVIDATCPLVTKVHQEAQRFERQQREIVLIGHAGHPEIEGTKGRLSGVVHVISTTQEVAALRVCDPSHLSYVTQTTLSVDDTREVLDALKARFPDIRGPALDDICYATQNRQNAVKALAARVDVLLVVGSKNSSNSNRLVELGRRSGLRSYRIDSEADLEATWFTAGLRVGLTAGASAPEAVVQSVLRRMAQFGLTTTVSEINAVREGVVFNLPHALRFARDESVTA